MKKIIYRISESVVVVLVMVSLIMIYMTAHEVTHYIDVKSYNNTEVEEICVLEIPLTKFELTSSIRGYVDYTYRGKAPDISEVKANIWGLLITLTFGGIASYSLLKREGDIWKTGTNLQ